MKKTIIFIFSIVLISCFPVKEIASKNYNFNENISFNIIKYSEPSSQPNYIINSNDKYVKVKIEMKNLTAYNKYVNFENFKVGSDEGIFDRYPLWKVNGGIQIAGTIKKEFNFLPNQSKKLSLIFIVPKEKKITHIIFNGNREEI